MKKYSNEFKVGVFVLLCLAGLAYLVLSTGKLNMGTRGYPVYAVFSEVAGLDKKAPVMLHGLEVGKVDDLKLSYDNDNTMVVLTLRINDGVKIREGSEVAIKTLGLMGEKFIQISSSKSGNFLKPGSTMQGKPYADMDTLISSLNSTVDENKDRMTTIAKNFEAFSDDVRRHPWKLLIKTKENK